MVAHFLELKWKGNNESAILVYHGQKWNFGVGGVAHKDQNHRNKFFGAIRKKTFLPVTHKTALHFFSSIFLPLPVTI